MLKQYTIEAAQQTILRRTDSLAGTYPPALIAGVETIFGPGTTPPQAVRQILTAIAQEGDQGILRWSRILDNYTGDAIEIPAGRLSQAAAELSPDLRDAMTLAIERIRAFHARQPLPNWSTGDLGGNLGQRAVPLQRVGVYVPGGSAPLPSSLLMGALPAQVAGVEEIVVCTPPEPHPAILAAAHLCGLTRVFQVGGAQAIGALAYGTATIPQVDKIVGPGNIFVTLAKQQVYGAVGIDSLAGPTETLIIADGSANPAWVAADLLAQAEHDPLAAALLLTPDPDLAVRVQREVAHQLEDLSRAEIIAASLEHRSGVIVTPDLDTAMDLANDYAPEHFCLVVEDTEAWIDRVKNAGALFVGEYSFEVLGDYVAGPNHVLPTGGTARFASTLSVYDFIKVMSVISLDPKTSAFLSRPAALIAQAETLSGHATAANLRTASEAGP